MLSNAPPNTSLTKELRRLVRCKFAACIVLLAFCCPGIAWPLTLVPFGPRVWHFHASLASADSVLASTPAGVFRSVDGGRTWSAAGSGNRIFADGGGVWSMVPDPTNPLGLYAVTFFGSLFRSSDDARTWVRIGFPGGEATAIAVHPRDGAVLLLGTKRGILRSADGGKAWVPVHTGQRIMVDGLMFDPERPQRVLAGTDRTILISDDTGLTWPNDLKPVLPFAEVAWIGNLKSHPRGSGLLSASAAGQPRLSSDAGSTWVRADGSCSSFDVAPDGKTMLTSCVRNYFQNFTKRSTDGGSTWEELAFNTANHFRGIASFWFDPRKPTLVLAAHFNGGVSRSEDGGRTWTDGSVGLRWCDVAAPDADVFVVHPQLAKACTEPKPIPR